MLAIGGRKKGSKLTLGAMMGRDDSNEVPIAGFVSGSFHKQGEGWEEAAAREGCCNKRSSWLIAEWGFFRVLTR